MTTTTKRPRTARPQVADVCRMVLIIRGESYTARPVDSDGFRAWRLRKADGTVHHVTETPHGPTCDCGDQIWRHEGRDAIGCKHLRACRALRLI